MSNYSLKPLYIIPIDAIKEETKDNPAFLKQKALEISTRICIIDKNNAEKKSNLINKLILAVIVISLLIKRDEKEN